MTWWRSTVQHRTDPEFHPQHYLILKESEYTGERQLDTQGEGIQRMKHWLSRIEQHLQKLMPTWNYDLIWKGPFQVSPGKLK